MERPEERGFPRAAKAGLVALALVGLLAVVALGARGSHPGGSGRIAQRHVPDQISNDLLTIILIAYVLGVIAMVIAFMKSRSKFQPRESHWIQNTLISTVVLLLFALLVQHLFTNRSLHRKAQQAARQGGAGGGAGRRQVHLRRITTGPAAHFDWVLAAGILGLLFVAGAAYYVRTRPTGIEPEEAAPDEVAELAAVVSDSIDDLRTETDARRAVIAAYARMEGVLGRHGHARRPAEAPFEYLSRILVALRVRGTAVRELTELFERAKFSPHPVDAPMKEQAISALVSVRDDLQAASA